MSVRYYKKYSIIFGNSLFMLNNTSFSKCCKSNREKKENINSIREIDNIEIKEDSAIDEKNIDEKNVDIFDKKDNKIDLENNINTENKIEDNINKNFDKITVDKLEKNQNENKNDKDENKNQNQNKNQNIVKNEKKIVEKNNNSEKVDNISLYNINKFYLVFKDNNLKDDELKILVDHYKYKNKLLDVDQYESLLRLINEDFDNEKLLKLIKLKLNYDQIKDDYEKFNDTITYENERIIYKINDIEYVCTGNKRTENINNIKYVESLHQILLDIPRIGNLLSYFIFENNENLSNFNNYILKKREENKLKKALTKLLVNSVLYYDLEYFQGMTYFAEFFLLLTAKKDNHNVTYNEKEALKLFNLFLNMKFDKIIIESYINKKEFQIKDFFNKELISKLLPNMKNLLKIINDNLEINLRLDNGTGMNIDEKYNKIFSSLIGILHNFNIPKVKTYNDLKKMFLLLFLTHNYNVIFDIFAISTLKFTTSNNNDEFLIDLSLD